MRLFKAKATRKRRMVVLAALDDEGIEGAHCILYRATMKSSDKKVIAAQIENIRKISLRKMSSSV
eukprot:UN16500